MAKRKRVTTSVSTLHNNIHNLVVRAKLDKRSDLLKEFAPLYKRTVALVAEYEAISQAIKPYVDRMLDQNVDIEDILAEVEEIEE